MQTTIKGAPIDLFVVAPGVWGYKDVFVNIYAINNTAENNWYLVDAGLRWSGSRIKRMGELLFGTGSKPAAIILTHGHFDHVGALKKLVDEWDIPVYAHHLEIPYLTGVSSYPPADPTVGGGLMADLSFVYPKGPINIEDKVVSLPQGGRIPGLPDWEYIHTPGHAPGHISLFRESDKVLISGDAFVSTKAESALSTMLQLKKISGPPKYFTTDWLSAASSVAKLASLEPEVVATGHGRPMRGAGMRKSLHNLVRDFQKVAVPAKGRYIHQPALMDDSGVVHIPPKNRNASTAPTLKILGISAVILLSMLFLKKSKKKKAKKEAAHRSGNNGHTKSTIKYKAKQLPGKVTDEVKKLKNNAADTKDEVKSEVSNRAGKLKSQVAKQAGEVKSEVSKHAEKVKSQAEKKAGEAKSELSKEAGKVKHEALDALDKLKFKVKKTFY